MTTRMPGGVVARSGSGMASRRILIDSARRTIWNVCAIRLENRINMPASGVEEQRQKPRLGIKSDRHALSGTAGAIGNYQRREQ